MGGAICKCRCHFRKVIVDIQPSEQEQYTFSPSLFQQLPFRDYLDTETAKRVLTHEFIARVVWNGISYIVFRDTDTATTYRWKLDTKIRSSLWLYADRECRRLIHVLEALVVRDAEWAKLPLKVKVRGESYYSPLYSHPLNAVRYPMMGLTEDGLCGIAKHADISQWLESQGFDPETTQGQVEGILDNVMLNAESRSGWNS
jgi:hypothetical protein